MNPDMQNPADGGRASRNQLAGWLHPVLTASDRQAQMLACRYCLSTSMARDLARLCFGGRRYD